MTYDREIIDYPCGFDPMQTHLKEVFENPKARALWIAYRAWHVSCQEDLDALKFGSLKIAKEIEKNPYILGDFDSLSTFIGNWLLQSSHGSFAFNYVPDQPSSTGIIKREYEHVESDAMRYTRFVLPYLKGEKVATIKINTSGKERSG